MQMSELKYMLIYFEYGSNNKPIIIALIIFQTSITAFFFLTFSLSPSPLLCCRWPSFCSFSYVYFVWRLWYRTLMSNVAWFLFVRSSRCMNADQVIFNIWLELGRMTAEKWSNNDNTITATIILKDRKKWHHYRLMAFVHLYLAWVVSGQVTVKTLIVCSSFPMNNLRTISKSTGIYHWTLKCVWFVSSYLLLRLPLPPSTASRFLCATEWICLCLLSWEWVCEYVWIY